MRISDWSSDVCASDLPTYEYNPVPLGNDLRDEVTKIIAGDDPAEGSLGVANEGVQIRQEGDRRALAIDRKSVESGKSGSESVALGGRRIIKKKQDKNKKINQPRK